MGRGRGLLLSIVAALLAACGGAMYEPGAVRRAAGGGAALSPPAQDAADGGAWWRMSSDVKVFHFRDGAGRPVLVLHGGPALPADAPWAGLHGLDGFAFHYFHQRGCGRSTRPFERFPAGWFSYSSNMKALEGALGLGAQLADVERVRRILGEERLVLVGHSFGALIAALYAAEFPEHVAALVLESPADLLEVPSPTGGLFSQVKARLAPAERARFDAYLERYLDFRHLFDRTESELSALHAEFGPFYAAALRANGIDPGAALPTIPPTYVGGFQPQALYLSMGRRHDWRFAGAAVRAPVLVLHGERDLQPLEATRAFAAAFPSAEVRVIPRAGHFAHDEQPEAFAREVRGFLERHGVHPGAPAAGRVAPANAATR